MHSFSDQVLLFGFSVWFPLLAGLDPHLMSAWRVRRSAAASADRDLRRTHCHADEAAGSRRSTSGGIGVGKFLFVARVTCGETGSSPRLIEKLQHVGFLGIMSYITLIKAHPNAGRLGEHRATVKMSS